MIYNSFNFIVFFPLIFVLYYVIPEKYQKCRNGFLLLVSYLLYLNWNPGYALVLFGITLVTYIGGRLLDSLKVVKRKGIICVFVTLALLPLLVFKYYNFVNNVFFALLSYIGLKFCLPGLNWAIPMGISFFTFQAVGYILDVYHQKIKAEKEFLTYALFISFFPSIVAGPINKASLVIPQLKAIRPYFDYNKATEGLKMLLWGMFMKVVVADRVGLYVDTVLTSYMNYTGVTCFVASLLYSFQIYADFAGYSMMAIGVGKTLGFELTENFRRPYFAISITDFWHRWHISLSTWLKDYIYIPLGGSHCSKLRNYWNIFITFLVSGIWHGANWTFIVWGCIHGVIQIVEKALGIQKYSGNNGFVKFGRIILTFLLVSFAWVFFRMPTLGDAFNVIMRIFDFSLPRILYISALPTPPLILVGCMLLFFKDFRDEFAPNRIKMMNNSNTLIRWITYIGLIVLILLMGVFSSDQFIYANF